MIYVLRTLEKKGLLISALFLAIVFTSMSYASAPFKSDESLTRVQKNAVLKVCSDAGFLPFEVRTASGGWTGFDVDMMKDFAKSIDVKLEMVQINFDGIIPALLANKCDMIAAAVTITPEREKVVSFSDVTFENGLSAALKNTKENRLKYQSFNSLDKENIKIAVRTGSTSDIYLTRSLKYAKIMRFDQDADLLLAVSQGKANAYVNDSTYVKLTNKTATEKFLILATPFASEKLSVAARKQDKILMEKFNSFLKNWKTDGSYKKTEKKYFGE